MIENSKVEMTEVVLPQYTNAIGTIFGGTIMSWIDICAAVSAQRYARSPVVTVSIDSVNFIKPIKEGFIVILKGKLNAVFKTSMEIGVKVFSENPLTGEKNNSVNAYCTFVSLDSEGIPKILPKLKFLNNNEKIESENAFIRRSIRLQALKK